MADKEALLHDIEIVMTFSSKYDMKKPEQAGKYVTFFESKNYFASGVGTSYIERLKEIQKGKINEPCFVCKKNPSYDGVLCTGCMNKYSRGKKQFYGQDDFADLDALFSDNDYDVNSGAEKNYQENSINDYNKVRTHKDVPSNKNNRTRKKWPKVLVICALCVIVLAAIPTVFNKLNTGTTSGGSSGNTSGGASSSNVLKFDEKSFMKAYENTLIEYAKETSSATDINYRVKYEFHNEDQNVRRYILFFLDEPVGILQFHEEEGLFSTALNVTEKDKLAEFLWTAMIKTLCPSLNSKDAVSFLKEANKKEFVEKDEYRFSFDYNATSKSYFLMASNIKKY